MIIITPPEVSSSPVLPRPKHLHRPLLALSAVMALGVVVMIILALVDPLEITGQDGWLKPLKFTISITIYALTLAVLIGGLTRFRRLGDLAGTVTAICLVVEMVVIIRAVALGTTSHFNVTTSTTLALWAIMAVSIVVVWVATLIIGVTLLFNPSPDPARNLAVRAGIGLAVIGMGLAFLMTGPTADQLSDFQGIAGAHTVGAPDGGPGLPLLGWSTIGGDLRIPHFIGIHALQALPLILIALELLGRRVFVLADAGVRTRLIMIVAITYAALMAILTGQALLGQSIIAPAGGVAVALLATPVAALIAVVTVLVRAER